MFQAVIRDVMYSTFFTTRKRSLGQGNIFAPVCHSVHGGSTWAGTLPGRYRSPRAGTPPNQCMLGYGQQAGGTHPTGMQTCSL